MELGCEQVAGISQLMLFHRPNKQTLDLMTKIHGITMVITVQDEKESVGDVIKLSKYYGLKHIWIPLKGAN